MGRHAADADLPEDRRYPHVLRDTFCTHLADTGADTAVIRELPPATPTPQPHRLHRRQVSDHGGALREQLGRA